MASITKPDTINAQQFIPAIQSYLRKHASCFIPQPFDRFALFKRITITLPSIPQLPSLVLEITVRVLFSFPLYYPAPFNAAKPLAYIEWFTPFSRPEQGMGLERLMIGVL
ncbi:hypothetical protein B0H13DRAFT_1865941 [Mycena leptocephala]|nr:hypothetical protein B0H13DRAFT_1865941 [Mycena leptocephala]